MNQNLISFKGGPLDGEQRWYPLAETSCEVIVHTPISFDDLDLDWNEPKPEKFERVIYTFHKRDDGSMEGHLSPAAWIP